MTEYPHDKVPLPVQLNAGASDAGHIGSAAPHPSDIVSPGRVSGFGRQAQAISYLDRALSIINDMYDADEKLAGLKLVDMELQQLLTVTMSEYRGPGSHCGANAIALRYVSTSLSPPRRG